MAGVLRPCQPCWGLIVNAISKGYFSYYTMVLKASLIHITTKNEFRIR